MEGSQTCQTGSCEVECSLPGQPHKGRRGPGSGSSSIHSPRCVLGRCGVSCRFYLQPVRGPRPAKAQWSSQRLRSHYDSSLRSSLLRFAQMDYYISLALQGRTANVSLDDVQLNHFNSPSRTDRSHGPSDAYADGEDKRGGFKGAFIPVDVVRRRQLYRETSLLESQPRPRPTCMGQSVRHCELREEKRGLSGLCLCRDQPRCR